MKKANTSPNNTDTTPEMVAHTIRYLEARKDSDRIRLENIKDNAQDQVDNLQQRIAEYTQRLESYKDDLGSSFAQIENIEKQIQELPTPEPVTEAQAEADLKRALSLSYVKGIVADDHAFIIHTRPNSLYTTLERKYSPSGRWYKVKPYKIPLPEYYIRVSQTPRNTLANNSDGLAIALVNESDTQHFLDWVRRRYSHEPHPHWGATAVPTHAPTVYRGICLGEYESEVTGAFKNSIADGIIALATYLQLAGSRHAYVHKRENWALWLGKKEYNLALIPSQKEVMSSEVVADDDHDELCPHGCYDDDGERICLDDCECECGHPN